VIGPHRKENVPESAARLMYTAAVGRNPEIEKAKQSGITIQSYAEALGELTRKNLTIAVAGSHGKSTTTALIGLILSEAGLDPTVILGTKLTEFGGSNFRKGFSRILVVEADEWNGSFLNYTPALAIVTNIDKEHLDFYKTHDGVKKAFKQFLLGTVPGARIVINADDQHAKTVGDALQKERPERFKNRVHYYSLASPETARIRPFLRLPGIHNASNAAAAYTVARLLDIRDEDIRNVLSRFTGAWRRFQEVGDFLGSPVIADYAHHPSEIRATIDACRLRFWRKRVIAVFQPHQYERTKLLFPEFETAFNGADTVCFLDIYEVAGRERKKRDPKIHSFYLAESLARKGIDAHYVSYSSRLPEFLAEYAGPRSVILMMGAGSIWEMTKRLIQEANNPPLAPANT
jgi:UDP-N-acetylmuramate--alanine ligase